MNKINNKFILISILIGFIVGGIIFTFNSKKTLKLNNNRDFSSFISVWGKGEGYIGKITSQKVSIYNNQFVHKFLFEENFRTSLNPVSKREDYIDNSLNEAEDCSNIEFDNLDKFGLQKIKLEEIKINDEANYSLILDKNNNNFVINHLIIKR